MGNIIDCLDPDRIVLGDLIVKRTPFFRYTETLKQKYTHTSVLIYFMIQ